MTGEEILALIQGGEGYRTEFKEHSGREPVFEERGGVLGTLYSRK